MDDVHVRPLLLADIPSVDELSSGSFADLDRQQGRPVEERSVDDVQRGHRRLRHLLGTDPDSAWLAEHDGRTVGCALAMRRGPVWFLSLLTVAPDVQGYGVGGRLLERVLGTADRERGAYLTASTDPKALRRYAAAGFELHPSLGAKGKIDRTVLPAVEGVRPGTADDTDLVDRVATLQRGGPMAPEWRYALEGSGTVTWVVDDADGAGYAITRGPYVVTLGATSEDAARRLLWTAVAEIEGEVQVEYVTAAQQWAVQVCTEARLTVRHGEPVCRQGELGPMSPYLPSGAFG